MEEKFFTKIIFISEPWNICDCMVTFKLTDHTKYLDHRPLPHPPFIINTEASCNQLIDITKGQFSFHQHMQKVVFVLSSKFEVTIATPWKKKEFLIWGKYSWAWHWLSAINKHCTATMNMFKIFNLDMRWDKQLVLVIFQNKIFKLQQK